MKRLAAVSNLSGRAESPTKARTGGVVVPRKSVFTSRHLGLLIAALLSLIIWVLVMIYIAIPMALGVHDGEERIEAMGAMKPAKAKGAKR